MNKVVRRCPVEGVYHIKDTNDVIMLASWSWNLQCVLGLFIDECKAAGMRINFSNFEAIVLNWKKVAFPLQLRGEALPRVEDEFKYFGVLFNSEGRTQRHINRWIGAATAVMRLLYQSVMVKKYLSQKAMCCVTCPSTFPPSPIVMSFE